MKPLRRRNVINRLYVIPIVSLVFCSPFARAESGPKDLAARTELHSIETLTLSDTQFLTGDANGKPTTTSGQFQIAGSGRLPVIVLQHGSGGMGANIEMWQKKLTRSASLLLRSMALRVAGLRR